MLRSWYQIYVLEIYYNCTIYHMDDHNHQIVLRILDDRIDHRNHHILDDHIDHRILLDDHDKLGFYHW